MREGTGGDRPKLPRTDSSLRGLIRSLVRGGLTRLAVQHGPRVSGAIVGNFVEAEAAIAADLGGSFDGFRAVGASFCLG